MKKLTLVVCVLLLAVSSGYASMTRVTSLNVPQWAVLGDDSNIWFTPADLVNYPNRVWGELGPTAAGLTVNPWGGFSKAGIFGGTLAVFPTRQPYTGITGNIANAAGLVGCVNDLTAIPNGANDPFAIYTAGRRTLVTLAPTNKIDVVYGLPLGEMNIGIGMTYASEFADFYESFLTVPTNAGDGAQSNVQNTNEVVLTGAVNMGNLDIIVNVDLPMVDNVYYERNWSAADSKYYKSDETFKTVGAMGITGTARMVMPMGADSLIVMGSYNYQNLPSQYVQQMENDADATLEQDVTTERAYVANVLTANVGVNKKAGDLLVIATAGAGWNNAMNNGYSLATELGSAVRTEYNWSQTILTLPVALGLESPLPWFGLVGRAGIAATYTKTITTADDPDYDPAAGDSLLNRAGCTTNVENTVLSAITLGLGKQITDSLSADLLLRQTAATGLLNSLTTQMSLCWTF